MIILKLFKKISNIIGLFDYPDYKRKIHNRKISCIGGLFILINITVFFIFNFFFYENLVSKNYFSTQLSFISFFTSLIIIFLMGFLDDKYNLKPNIKIFILILVIISLLIIDKDLRLTFLRFSFYEEVYDISNFSLFFTTLCILVFINSFNMYDGSNLQVSSLSILIFSYLLFLQNKMDFFLITLIISLTFFSILNFKNKLFLGDNGSLILSFIICYTFIKLYNNEIVLNSDQVCLLMLLPVIDLLRLFIVRIFNRKSPFKPDKNHLHHLLIKKYDLRKMKLILFGMYSIPVFLGILTGKYLLFIILQILIYFATYLNCKKKKVNAK